VAGVIAEPLPQRKVRPLSYQTGIFRADGARQLSIYPEQEREIIVVDSPSVLETQIGVIRRAVTGVAHDAHAQVHGVVSKWIGIEHAVERVSSPTPNWAVVVNV
jgi:MICOS complex subunit MIC26